MNAPESPLDEPRTASDLCVDRRGPARPRRLAGPRCSTMRIWSTHSDFAEGLRRDEAAVRAAVALPWNNGQTEGQVNRLQDAQAPDVRAGQPRAAAPTPPLRRLKGRRRSAGRSDGPRGHRHGAGLNGHDAVPCGAVLMEGLGLRGFTISALNQSHCHRM